MQKLRIMRWGEQIYVMLDSDRMNYEELVFNADGKLIQHIINNPHRTLVFDTLTDQKRVILRIQNPSLSVVEFLSDELVEKAKIMVLNENG